MLNEIFLDTLLWKQIHKTCFWNKSNNKHHFTVYTLKVFKLFYSSSDVWNCFTTFENVYQQNSNRIKTIFNPFTQIKIFQILNMSYKGRVRVTKKKSFKKVFFSPSHESLKPIQIQTQSDLKGKRKQNRSECYNLEWF